MHTYDSSINCKIANRNENNVKYHNTSSETSIVKLFTPIYTVGMSRFNSIEHILHIG